MRPEVLFPLFAPIQSLPKVGPKTAKALEKISIYKVADALFHLPYNVIDRRYRPKVSEIKNEGIATVMVRIVEHIPSQRRGMPYRVIAEDETGQIEIVFFQARPDYILGKLPTGEERLISGEVGFFQNKPQMTHPEHILRLEETYKLNGLEARYGLTASVHQKTIQNIVYHCLKRVPSLPEWVDETVLKRQGWCGWQEALTRIHQPEELSDIDQESKYYQRLAYDEFFANQLTLQIVRASYKKTPGKERAVKGTLRNKYLNTLPFDLTNAQQNVLAEIDEDMASSSKMIRLLQGDVGSGKTVVAALAALTTIENHEQVAFMSPTSILATQHFNELYESLGAIGVRVEILTGKEKGKKREKVLEELKAGDIDIVVGTHALFQDDVVFKALGLAIIDEQHRFGVEQRLKLSAKGEMTDILVMTATPIPRTLLMSAYGDLDVSRMTEKPPGRQKIETRTIPTGKIADVVAGLKRALEKGTKIYWICPLVEESEELELMSVEERFNLLQKVFGETVDLIHGKMKEREKDNVMERFINGDVNILVATTVIEVGVNVPEATIMIIEHAERFGLAQLHQLRGRVGRGSEASNCLLMYKAPLSETATARLKTMRESDDGFYISEQDMKLRGAGEVLGKRQSGLPEYKIADFYEHADLIGMARDDARLLLEKDPRLISERGKAAQTLLHLFEKDQVVSYIESG